MNELTGKDFSYISGFTAESINVMSISSKYLTISFTVSLYFLKCGVSMCNISYMQKKKSICKS